jgi:hypothetical protein
MGTHTHRARYCQSPKPNIQPKRQSLRLNVLQSRPLGLDLFLLSVDDDLHKKLSRIRELPRADEYGSERAKSVDPCFISRSLVYYWSTCRDSRVPGLRHLLQS